jgi:alcohol dehydrogenase class IV
MKTPGIDGMSLEEAQKAAAAFKDVRTPGSPRSVTEADLLVLYKEAF